MSVGIDSRSSRSYDELRIGEAVAHIVSASSIVEGLGECDYTVQETMRKYVDLWIVEMSPISYVPGMVEALGDMITKKITEIFENISEDELGYSLDLLLDFKRRFESGILSIDQADIEVRCERILNSLGVDVNKLAKFIERDKINGLISAVVIALGIASVRDRKWTPESQ
ncbi:hypothetical protein [Sulfuracidifex tepidarius]|uniref:Uncharacterized protein n=1 Tax=Sulfuracidifex tepidarius TaxID=1294262 RepID=A0A510E6P1_9CREN|nr:hypothetical protein [Sulfuracidifex tepidarius]BBG25417.1 hypothetical protein IC006_2753 [Sulfuracidifex tepidarius]BBG28211.1 hypothetical protein IC007_2767 [Sulfuracidifex tepidarius]